MTICVEALRDRGIERFGSLSFNLLPSLNIVAYEFYLLRELILLRFFEAHLKYAV